MFIDSPNMKRRSIAPVKARGIVNMIKKGFTKDSNWAAITIYTSTMASIITRPKDENVSFIISFVPPSFAL